MMTHHIRKTGGKVESADEMRDAIRGSNAIVNNLRCVVGVWNDPDDRRTLAALKREYKRDQAYKAAVLKSNNPDSFSHTKNLVRSDKGILEDQTIKIRDGNVENRKWIVAAIKLSAEDGYPFTRTGSSSMFQRKRELPEQLQTMTRRSLESMVDYAIDQKEVIPAGQGTSWLDVPDGAVASGARKGAKKSRPTSELIDWSLYEIDRLRGDTVQRKTS